MDIYPAFGGNTATDTNTDPGGKAMDPDTALGGSTGQTSPWLQMATTLGCPSPPLVSSFTSSAPLILSHLSTT